MTKDEALDLALEALEVEQVAVTLFNLVPKPHITKAITAIKQARSAPVLKPVVWVEYETGNHTKRPPNCGTSYCSCIECVMEPAPVQKKCDCAAHSEAECVCGAWDSSPAAQRQWVGLAEEDKHKPDMGAYVYLNDDWLDGYKTGMEYAEAKLKEKNT